MNNKLILSGEEARNKLFKGIEILTDAVKVTLGPKGKNVLLDSLYNYPVITKDGVSVAKEVMSKDYFQNAGIKFLKGVAQKTCDEVGDATTTSCILSYSLIKYGFEAMKEGHSPLGINKGIKKAVNQVVNYIQKHSIPVDFEKLNNIATISSNNDAYIGNLITEGLNAVSLDGVLAVDDSPTGKTYLDVVQGMRFNRGYVSPFFATDEFTQECILDQPYVICYQGKLDTIKPIAEYLETASRNNNSVLIVANDYDPEVIRTFTVNKLQNRLKIAAIRSPGFGETKKEVFEDFIISIGGNPENILSIGNAEKITITQDSTTIINGKGNLENRIKSIEQQLEEPHTEEVNKVLKERLVRLKGGIGILYVGGNSEAEQKELKDRCEDAVCATKAAIEEGVVCGGGITYIRAIKSLNKLKCEDISELEGVDIVRKTLFSPLIQICINAEVEASTVIAKVLEKSTNFGYNALTNSYGNMVTMGILDAAKASRIALENAASVATTILTIEHAICEEEKNLDNSY